MGLLDQFRKPKDYTVKVDGLNVLLYQEGDKAIRIETGSSGKEDGFKKYVRLSVVKHWESPHQDVEINDEDRERIKTRVEAWLNRRFKRTIVWD